MGEYESPPPPPSNKKYIVLAIVAIAIIIALITGYMLFSSHFQKVNTPVPTATPTPYHVSTATPIPTPYYAPTPTPASTVTPLFSVTLSPSTQLIVVDLNQMAKFDVTITGNPKYPCSITIHGGSQSYEPKYTVNDSGLINAPKYSNGDSLTFGSFSPLSEQSGDTTTYYVSVIDSLGNSATSNQVQVSYK